MKKIKSYTSIWRVEKVLYAISDFNLPFPVTFTQMAWFVAMILLVMILGDMPPLLWVDSVLLKYLGIPAGVTWIMSQKAFDGKKPFNFLKSAVAFMIRPKKTFAGKTVRLKKKLVDESITLVRSEAYGSEKCISD